MSKIMFDESATLWVSEDDDVLHVATPTDAELEEQEWAQFVSVHEAETKLNDQSLTIRQMAEEIRVLREQRDGLIKRSYKTGAWINLIKDTADEEIEAAKGQIK